MLARGAVVERYVVEAHLGSGGMAEVYLVRHVALGTMRALKVVSDDNPRRLERVSREGRLQARLRHPNVVSLFDVVPVNGRPGLLMEYVDGPTLAEVVRRFPPSVAQVDALVRGMLTGVAAAHEAGMIHRDLKPANILLACRDGHVLPRIADFGLARALAETDRLRTRSGAAMGTLDYMAPEQIRSAADVDARADVFSLGCVLYELVTGAPPFLADDVIARHAAITARRWRPVEERAPSLPLRMEAAIRAALEPDPADRPADAGALLSLWAAGTPEPRDAWESQHVARIAALRAPPGAVEPGTAGPGAGPVGALGQTRVTGAAAGPTQAGLAAGRAPVVGGPGPTLAAGADATDAAPGGLTLAAAGFADAAPGGLTLAAGGPAAPSPGGRGQVQAAAPDNAARSDDPPDDAPSFRPSRWPVVLATVTALFTATALFLSAPTAPASPQPSSAPPDLASVAPPSPPSAPATPPATPPATQPERLPEPAPPMPSAAVPPPAPSPTASSRGAALTPASPPAAATAPPASVWTVTPEPPRAARWSATGVDRATLVGADGRPHPPGAIDPGRYHLRVVFPGEAGHTDALDVTLAPGADRAFTCQPLLRSCR